MIRFPVFQISTLCQKVCKTNNNKKTKTKKKQIKESLCPTKPVSPWAIKKILSYEN